MPAQTRTTTGKLIQPWSYFHAFVLWYNSISNPFKHHWKQIFMMEKNITHRLHLFSFFNQYIFFQVVIRVCDIITVPLTITRRSSYSFILCCRPLPHITSYKTLIKLNSRCNWNVIGLRCFCLRDTPRVHILSKHIFNVVVHDQLPKLVDRKSVV